MKRSDIEWKTKHDEIERKMVDSDYLNGWSFDYSQYSADVKQKTDDYFKSQGIEIEQ